VAAVGKKAPAPLDAVARARVVRVEARFAQVSALPFVGNRGWQLTEHVCAVGEMFSRYVGTAGIGKAVGLEETEKAVGLEETKAVGLEEHAAWSGHVEVGAEEIGDGKLVVGDGMAS